MNVLYATSYQTILDSVKADGFNTVRIAWSDINLTATPNSSAVDYNQNPDLKGLNTRAPRQRQRQRQRRPRRLPRPPPRHPPGTR